MGFKGLTVNRPEDEDPHIYAENDAAIYQAILGDGDMLLNYGDCFSITILSYNSVQVNSGLLAVQGHMGVIEIGDAETLTLSNGTSGVTRNDLVVARFTTTGNHGEDTFKLDFLTGNSDGSDPTYTAEDLNDGGKTREFPIARVTMTGLNITAVEMLVEPATCMKDLLHALNERISYGTETPSSSYGEDGDIYIMYEA